MAQEFRLDERELSKAQLNGATLVASRAFFDDPFFRFLSPGDRLRERGLAIFFRANLAHMGEGARVITVRDKNDTIIDIVAWLPPGRYPQSAGTQLAQIPGTLRALYRRPRALLDGKKYLTTIAKSHSKSLTGTSTCSSPTPRTNVVA